MTTLQSDMSLGGMCVKCRHRSTPRATPPSLGPISCSRSCAWWRTPWRSAGRERVQAPMGVGGLASHNASRGTSVIWRSVSLAPPRAPTSLCGKLLETCCRILAQSDRVCRTDYGAFWRGCLSAAAGCRETLVCRMGRRAPHAPLVL
jgi:hypothetical protein